MELTSEKSNTMIYQHKNIYSNKNVCKYKSSTG